MGRARQPGAGGEVVLPRGLTRRRNAGRDVIQIAFSYRGIECRERLLLNPDDRKDVKLAVGLRAEILRKIELGSFLYTDYFPASPRAVKFGIVVSKKTMKELLEDALTAYQAAEALRNLSPSTVEGYRKIIMGDLIPYFGDYTLRDVTPALVRKWMGTMTCTNKTARNRISLLRSVLDDAVEDALIDENPLGKISTKKVLARTTTMSKFEVDPFDQSERDAILAAAGKRDPQAKNFFQFAFWSGLRTSELIGLEWGDIDWINGAVRIRRVVVTKKDKHTTKTPAGKRDVYLLPAARAALEAQKAHTFLAGQRVFHNPHTGRPWETDKQVRVHCWAYILKAAGVRYRNPYQTRHTYASTLLSRGENELWLAGQLGHKGVEMIRRHYGKWIPQKDMVIPTVNDWSNAA